MQKSWYTYMLLIASCNTFGESGPLGPLNQPTCTADYKMWNFMCILKTLGGRWAKIGGEGEKWIDEGGRERNGTQKKKEREGQSHIILSNCLGFFNLHLPGEKTFIKYLLVLG